MNDDDVVRTLSAATPNLSLRRFLATAPLQFAYIPHVSGVNLNTEQNKVTESQLKIIMIKTYLWTSDSSITAHDRFSRRNARSTCHP